VEEVTGSRLATERAGESIPGMAEFTWRMGARRGGKKEKRKQGRLRGQLLSGVETLCPVDNRSEHIRKKKRAGDEKAYEETVRKHTYLRMEPLNLKEGQSGKKEYRGKTGE